MELNQYQIVLVNLNPTKGSEIRKKRPCVIISPNAMNHNLRIVVIAPMTTKSKKYPSRVRVTHSQKVNWVVIDQIRTIDKTRIIKTLGKLSSPKIKEVKSVIKKLYVD